MGNTSVKDRQQKHVPQTKPAPGSQPRARNLYPNLENEVTSARIQLSVQASPVIRKSCRPSTSATSQNATPLSATSPNATLPSAPPPPLPHSRDYVSQIHRTAGPLSPPEITPCAPLLPQLQASSNPPRKFRQRSHDVPPAVSCSTCKGPFTAKIFQCESNGHNNCARCKDLHGRCGECSSPIAGKRNFALEAIVGDMLRACDNKESGCTLRFKGREMSAHLRECPHSDLQCPVLHCTWLGKINQIGMHCEERHPQIRRSVGDELFVPNVYSNNVYQHFVELGPFKFIITVKISDQQIYMIAQLVGTKVSASKWNYEFHVYNKQQPKRKFYCQSVCSNLATPVEEITKEADCVVMPIPLATTYINASKMTYKFYIKKYCN